MTYAFGGRHSIQLSYGCIRGAWRGGDRSGLRTVQNNPAAKQLTSGLLAYHARRINGLFVKLLPSPRAELTGSKPVGCVNCAGVVAVGILFALTGAVIQIQDRVRNQRAKLK